MNILVTAIGSFSADCVISSLHNAGCNVVGCDIYPSEWHAVSKECDAVYQAPYATNEKEYLCFLVDISKRHAVKYLFPLTDLEIDVLNRNRKLFAKEGIVLCMPSEETLTIARDKYRLYKTFEEDSQIPSINTYLVGKDKIPENLLPAIAKPYNGRSSEGLHRITTSWELQEFSHRDGYILQEQKEGPVFTVDYVRCVRTGRDFSIPREELLRTKNGAGTTVRIVNDNRLTAMVSHIGEIIGVNGCVNMEFIYSDGDYYLIDINPRFSAGVAFSRVAGYDMVLSHLNCYMGKDIESPVSYEEQIVTKRYKEEILWIKNEREKG